MLLYSLFEWLTNASANPFRLAIITDEMIAFRAKRPRPRSIRILDDHPTAGPMPAFESGGFELLAFPDMIRDA